MSELKKCLDCGGEVEGAERHYTFARCLMVLKTENERLKSRLKLFTDELTLQSIDEGRFEVRKCATLGLMFRDIYRNGDLFASQILSPVASKFVEDPLGEKGTNGETIAYGQLFQPLPVMRRYIIDTAKIIDELADTQEQLAKLANQ